MRRFGHVLLGAACLGNTFSWSGEGNPRRGFFAKMGGTASGRGERAHGPQRAEGPHAGHVLPWATSSTLQALCGGAEHPRLPGTGDLHLGKGLGGLGFAVRVVAQGSRAPLGCKAGRTKPPEGATAHHVSFYGTLCHKPG